MAAVFGVYASPLPTSLTIFVSIVGAGLPIALSYGAMGLEFSVGQFAAAAWRYWRDPRRFLPGPGESASGYAVRPEPVDEDSHATQPPPGPASSAEGEALWDV